MIGYSFRIVTYNVHKCRGLDRRVRPARIAAVLRETEADLIALQEVLSIEGSVPERDQARFLAEELGMYFCVGENRRLDGGAYGNVTLSRWPLDNVQNYDITWRGREPRGCLRADATPGPSALIHVFNIHLGTAFFERRHQARQLVASPILANPSLGGARLVLGDFNEWTHGLASQLLGAHLESADLRHHLRRARTYPGPLPFLHLDHIYYDRALELQRLTLHRSRTALIASDHLPLVADFRLRAL
ncbi:MAG TPA: endonuclease/exonuclease/phosphatase family protein [Pyrinomonadaceae bacterium]|jgi:endonuclease/exonuclease/phosphatase family metal-dependent hydrolase|nr:endonuclease/exonuclease/phosphatase family protein [Pyrinomonadaceae bacterium]